MSIVSNNNFDWHFAANGGSRTYTYTNNNNYPVYVNTFSVYLGSGNGAINGSRSTTITPVQTSKTGATSQLARAAALAESNWNWFTYTASGGSYSATATISYNGSTDTASATVSQNVTPSSVGTRDTSTATYTITYTSEEYVCRITGSNPYASQGYGNFNCPSTKTTFTFNDAVSIPAGASASITLTYGGSGVFRGYAFYNNSDPAVTETQASPPVISDVTENTTKYSNLEVKGYSTTTFTITATDATSYKVMDGSLTLYSGTSNSGSFTLPSNTTGTITYYAINGTLSDSEAKTHTAYDYQAGGYTVYPLSQRSDADGTLNDEGVYAKLSATFTQGQILTSPATSLTTTLTYTIVGTSYTDTITSGTPVVDGGSLSTSSNYTVNYVLEDSVSSATYPDVISVAKFLVDFVDNGVAIGTTATAGYFDIGSSQNNLGVRINGNALTYVIAEGTSGIWTFRKWSNGDYECWTSQDLTISGWTAWGGLYNSSNALGPLTLPITFTAVPIIQVTAYSDQGTLFSLSEGGAPTTTQTGTYSASRGSTGSTWLTSATFNIYVKGKWQ